MGTTHSSILSNRACRGLERIGDIMLPAAEGFPTFSELGCIERVDTIIAYAPSDDANSLNMLLTVLAFAPAFVLRFIVRTMGDPGGWPDSIATVFRLMDMGIRGLVLGLYYSGLHGVQFHGKTPPDVIGFELCRVPRGSLTHTRP